MTIFLLSFTPRNSFNDNCREDLADFAYTNPSHLYVPVPSQEPAIQWLLFVAVHRIYFSFILLCINQAVSLLSSLIVKHLWFRGLSMLIVWYVFCSLLRALLWPIVVNFYIYVIWSLMEKCHIGSHTSSSFFENLYLINRKRNTMIILSFL